MYINADNGKMAASGIAEYDKACREGFIEWVQVLPEYRRKGFGKRIVDVLLYRLKNIGAEFATVSGNLDNITEPLALYRKCGFEESGRRIRALKQWDSAVPANRSTG